MLSQQVQIVKSESQVSDSSQQIQQKSNISQDHSFAKQQYKIVSFSINGLQQAMKNGLLELVEQTSPDILCISETKIAKCNLPKLFSSVEFKTSILFQQYTFVFSSVDGKLDICGTVVFLKKNIHFIKAENYTHLVPKNNIINSEGRYIKINFKQFTLIHVYSPNSGRGNSELLTERLQYDEQIRKIVAKELESNPNVILCGNLNVVAEKIDIDNWEDNVGKPCMRTEEQIQFQQLMQQCNLVDSFRLLNPRVIKYSWLNQMQNITAKDKGCRVDYFMVSKSLIDNIVESDIIDNLDFISSHAPIILKLNFE